MSMTRQAGIILPGYNPLLVANAPTIGTATAGSSSCASVTFCAPACTGGSVITTYTVFSNCGAKTATGASSPLTVTGLTVGTSYTFKVVATNIYGSSYPSAASNSVTATVVTCATYTTAGTYSWVAPSGVTSVAVVAIGGGGDTAGGGGGLGYKNGYAVTPGSSYTVVVGARTNDSYFVSTAVVKGGKGTSGPGGAGGTYTGDGGGNGGNGGSSSGGGGGAGGYAGNGGNGGGSCVAGTAGSGGGGGGGAREGAVSGYVRGGGGGGGVGLYGQGSNGAGGATVSLGGGGGSGGSNGGNGSQYVDGCGVNHPVAGSAGLYGAGGGNSSCGGAQGARGAVRIVWCSGGARGTPSFPSTNVGP